jgi:hypothetical protein
MTSRCVSTGKFLAAYVVNSAFPDPVVLLLKKRTVSQLFKVERTMDKQHLLQCIIEKITLDAELALSAAKAAHEAAINEETQPDNKYDTLSLEASYIAQGHANRAQELKKALEVYKKLEMQSFAPYEPFYLTALVGIEYEDGRIRQLFLGPDAGGLKVNCDGEEIVVITPGSPLCAALLGKQVGDVVSAGRATDKEFEIISVC